MENKGVRSFCLCKHFHGSKSEAAYCNWLFARKQAREIKDFKWHYSIRLHINGKFWKSWEVDFRVEENDGSYTYHESKGWNRSDDNFRLKLAAVMTEYPTWVFIVNKEPAYITPGGRLMLEGLKRKLKKGKTRTYRSYNRKLERWETIVLPPRKPLPKFLPRRF